MMRFILLGCAAAVGILLLSLGIVTLILYDPYVDSVIEEELVIRNGTEVYEVWKNPPIVPHLYVYFFNITNPAEFLDGEKAVLQEIGPYCYREHWQKVNVSFFDNGTVTYQTQRFYFFEPERSKGNENDTVTTINIPMISAIMKLRYSSRLLKLALSSMLEVLKERPIVHHTVEELMWGYDDPLIKIAKDILPPDKSFPFDKFGFFYNKNGSTDGVFNVFTGEHDMRRYTSIDLFDHKKKLDFWKTDECNTINGTDGSSYPPRITKKTKLSMFNKNICRSLPLVYSKDVEHYGVQGYRFSPPSDVFAYPKDNPANECYCVDGPPCPGGGVFNISTCQFGAPTLISWPHFYQADKKYLNAVVGLKPDPSKHALYVDLAPRTGIPLTAQARLQINVYMAAVPPIKQSLGLQTMVFPVIWFEDGVEKMPEDLIEKIQMSQNLPEVLKVTFLSCFFLIGSTLMVIVFIAFIANLFNVRVKFLNPSLKEDSSPAATSSSHAPKTQVRGYSNPTMGDGSDVDNP